MKRYYLIICIAMILISTVSLVIRLSIPAEAEPDKAQVNYGQTGGFTYQIYMKPSYLYGQTPPVYSSNPKYPLAAVETVDFNYTFDATEKRTGTAYVEAVLEDPGIWRKRMVLAPETAINGNFALSFALKPDQIAGIFEEIEKETGITASPHNLSLNVHAKFGSDSFVQSLPVILGNNLMEISNNLSQSLPAGKGRFDYTVQRKAVPVVSETPAAGTTYDIDLKPVAVAAAPDFVLNPGQAAFTRLIDRMNVSFNYEFYSDQSVDALNTDVNINAVIESPKAWTRTFPLLQTKKSGNFSVTVPVDIAGYLALMQDIANETGVSPDSYNISIIANLKTTGETSFGKIEEIFTPTLKGTIAGNILKWDENLTTDQPGSIKAASAASNGGTAGAARSISGAFAVVFLVLFGLFLALYLWRRPAAVSEREKETLHIKKKYGTRLVEAVSQTSPEEDKVISLGSMEDLIKVADELGKPVMYQVAGPNRERPAYFVLDGTTRYEWYSSGTPEGGAGK